MTTEKKMTLWHSDYEWVVAESPDDATLVLVETHGGKPEDFSEDTWTPWGEARVLSITDDRDIKTTLTGAEWAARGRAYIGTTEY